MMKICRSEVARLQHCGPVQPTNWDVKTSKYTLQVLSTSNIPICPPRRQLQACHNAVASTCSSRVSILSAALGILFTDNLVHSQLLEKTIPVYTGASNKEYYIHPSVVSQSLTLLPCESVLPPSAPNTFGSTTSAASGSLFGLVGSVAPSSRQSVFSSTHMSNIGALVQLPAGMPLKAIDWTKYSDDTVGRVLEYCYQLDYTTSIKEVSSEQSSTLQRPLPLRTFNPGQELARTLIRSELSRHWKMTSAHYSIKILKIHGH
jgi:hypothetical protein